MATSIMAGMGLESPQRGVLGSFGSEDAQGIKTGMDASYARLLQMHDI